MREPDGFDTAFKAITLFSVTKSNTKPNENINIKREASKNKFIRDELAQYYLHKGDKWTKDGKELLPIQIQCIKQQIHRWKKKNNEGL